MGIFSAIKKAKEVYRNQEGHGGFSLGGGPLSISRAKKEYKEQTHPTEQDWRRLEYMAMGEDKPKYRVIDSHKIEEDYDVLGEDENGVLVVRKKKTWW